MALETNAHARVHDTSWQKSRPCPMILRELSMDYIREAERTENEGVTRVESSEQISAGLDAIARYFFARALRNAK
jgi:hypothetical protein